MKTLEEWTYVWDTWSGDDPPTFFPPFPQEWFWWSAKTRQTCNTRAAGPQGSVCPCPGEEWWSTAGNAATASSWKSWQLPLTTSLGYHRWPDSKRKMKFRVVVINWRVFCMQSIRNNRGRQTDLKSECHRQRRVAALTLGLDELRCDKRSWDHFIFAIRSGFATVERFKHVFSVSKQMYCNHTRTDVLVPCHGCISYLRIIFSQSSLSKE